MSRTKHPMKNFITLVLKGVAMGAANVIPGVSGGTIALITGIFEKLIDSIKSLDLKAVRLLFTGKFKALSEHINFWFLVAVFLGVGISIFSLAWVLNFLFINYPVYIWAYFFGLILASVYFVGKTIGKWSWSVIISFIVGTAAALTISLLTPATENDSLWYLLVCGVVAVCSMILPGLSGSFVLLLMGNYQLVMIEAVKDVNIKVLLPVAVGAVAGLIAFSHFLSWLFKKFKDQTIAVLTGFILGSLAILWPWKHSFDINGDILPIDEFGAFIDTDGKILEDIKVFGYKQYLPDSFPLVIIIAVGFMIIGILSIWLIEKFAATKSKDA